LVPGFGDVRTLEPQGLEAPRFVHQVIRVIICMVIEPDRRAFTSGRSILVFSRHAMVSVLLFGIVAISVHHLLHGSYHLLSRDFVRLMQQSTRSGLKLKMQMSFEDQCWKLDQAAALLLIQSSNQPCGDLDCP
jgi:hypothetical protein